MNERKVFKELDGKDLINIGVFTAIHVQSGNDDVYWNCGKNNALFFSVSDCFTIDKGAIDYQVI